MRRAMYVDVTVTLFADGTGGTTPADALSRGIGPFLSRVADQFDAGAGGGVVLLGRGAARQLGVADDGFGAEVPTGDWQSRPGDKGDWCKFWRDGYPTIRVGCYWLLKGDNPLLAPHPVDTVASMELWHRLVGVPFYMTIGSSGIDLLFRLTPRGQKEPTWRPNINSMVRSEYAATEDDYDPQYWRGPPPRGERFMWAYDLNRAYLAAALSVEVCPWTLTYGGKNFDRSRGGWWLCELAPWQLEHIPDPAGYTMAEVNEDRRKTRVRWITTPTLALLETLTEQSFYGGVRILDSRTGPGRQLLRPWAEKLRDAYAHSHTIRDEDEHAVTRVRDAIKQCGHITLGLIDKPSNAIYRPDWWHSIIAYNRSNLWRRMWHAGGKKIHPEPGDRWPSRIETDCVWYASDIVDWEQAAPPGFKLDIIKGSDPAKGTGIPLGHFKPGKSRKLSTERATTRTKKGVRP